MREHQLQTSQCDAVSEKKNDFYLEEIQFSLLMYLIIILLFKTEQGDFYLEEM